MYNISQADMERLDRRACQAEEKAAALEIALSAWQKAFGTGQLSHDRVVKLKHFVAFVVHGLVAGNIKSKAVMDTSDPHATEWPVRTLGEYAAEVTR